MEKYYNIYYLILYIYVLLYCNIITSYSIIKCCFSTSALNWAVEQQRCFSACFTKQRLYKRLRPSPVFLLLSPLPPPSRHVKTNFVVVFTSWSCRNQNINNIHRDSDAIYTKGMYQLVSECLKGRVLWWAVSSERGSWDYNAWFSWALEINSALIFFWIPLAPPSQNNPNNFFPSLIFIIFIKIKDYAFWFVLFLQKTILHTLGRPTLR